jgi:hypothetical protein
MALSALKISFIKSPL